MRRKAHAKDDTRTMTLAELNSILKSIPGFEKKVAYRAFPKGKAPALPFICYLATQTSNFDADNTVYHVVQGVDIELYTRRKDEASEAAVEAALNENNIVWEKYEEYIDDEEVYQITYEVEV